MGYISRRKLESLGEPIGDMSSMTVDRRRIYHGGGKGDSPPPPDYTPVAQASEAAAKIGAEQADRVLAESQRQFNTNQAVAAPVVAAQLGIMNQTKQQGDDYYNYLKEYRPAERQLLYDASGLSADQVAEINAMRAQESADYQGQLAAARQAYEDDLLKSAGITPTPGASFDLSQIKDVAVPAPEYGSGKGGQRMAMDYVRNPGMSFSSYKPVAKNQAEIDAAIKQNETNAQVRASLGGVKIQQGNASAPQGFDASGIKENNSRSEALAAKYMAMGQSALQARDSAERELLTGSDTAVYDANKGDIENDVARAVADTQGGYTRSLNQMARQGRRYGLSGNAIAANAGSVATNQAAAIAAAANGTRNQGIDSTRGRLTTRRGMRIQDDTLNWGKRLDAVGLAKGMPGASQGAYSVATNAGNAAVNNQMAPGNALVAGMGTAGSLAMQGQNMKLNGLSSILNAQTSIYNNSQDSGGGFMGGLGSLLGGGAAVYTA
jgi:hypothetical protein